MSALSKRVERRRAGVATVGVGAFAAIGAIVLRCVGLPHASRSGLPRAGERIEADAHGWPVGGTAGWTFAVPHAAGPILLDGDNDDPGWVALPGPARTGPWSSPTGAAARPYSDARMLWGDSHLYILLYAADDDVRSQDDMFRLKFWSGTAAYSLAVSADGSVRDERVEDRAEPRRAWRSGVHVSREIDGTVDDPLDTDEEWSIEMAIPFASLGMRGERGETVGLFAVRCDAPASTERPCGRWGHDDGTTRLVIE